MWQVPAAVLDSADHDSVAQCLAQFFVDKSRVRRPGRGDLSSGEPTSFDVLELTDGRIVERQSSPQLLDGRVVGRVWTYRDITEQRRAEEALRDESRVLELVNATGRELATKRDLRSAVQAVTDAGTQMIGAQFGAFFYNMTDEKGRDVSSVHPLGRARRGVRRNSATRARRRCSARPFAASRRFRSDDILHDPRYGHWAPHHGMPKGHLPVRSYLAVPVVSRSGEVIGGLFFGHAEAADLRRASRKDHHRHRRPGCCVHRQRTSVRRRAGIGRGTRDAAGERARGTEPGGTREYAQRRLSRDAVARAAHAAEFDPGMGPDPSPQLRQARGRTQRSRRDRAQCSGADPAHRRPSGHEPDRIRQGAARHPAGAADFFHRSGARDCDACRRCEGHTGRTDARSLCRAGARGSRPASAGDEQPARERYQVHAERAAKSRCCWSG